MREAYGISIPIPRHSRHGIYAEAIEAGPAYGESRRPDLNR